MGDINTVGIVGSGIMGSGLAEVAAKSGFEVIVRSRTRAGRRRRRRRPADEPRQAGGEGARSRPTTGPRSSPGSRATDHLGKLADCDLVIESVVEDLAVKKELFAELEQIVKPSGILATNTSTLPVIELAMATQRPDQVCGIHFFNPAPMMKLVEVIRPITASDDTIKTALAFATACGKDAVEVVDRAGFVVNALLFPYLNNAVRMLEHGTATMEDIDTAMKGGCNFPMGPFALLDLVGLDTSLAILDALYAEFRDPNYAAVADAAAQGGGRAARPQDWPRLLSVLDTRLAGEGGRARCSRRRLRRTPPSRQPAAEPVGAARRHTAPTPTASSASAATSSRARCSRPTAAACSRCRTDASGIVWFSPDPRAILPLDGLRLTKSLRRSTRRYTVTRRHRVRRGDGERAATPAGRAAGSTRRSSRRTRACTSSGWAHSFEARDDDGRLVGGLYGVRIGGFFAGESMFHHATDASKVALVELVDWLNDTDARLLDVQWPTPHLTSLGAITVTRDDYLAAAERRRLVSDASRADRDSPSVTSRG